VWLRDSGKCGGAVWYDPRSGSESALQRAIREATSTVSLAKPVSCHTLGHPFATHLVEDGHDMRAIQEQLGPRDVSTIMMYTHVLRAEPGRKGEE
jgi:site-specific recombinase XerD